MFSKESGRNSSKIELILNQNRFSLLIVNQPLCTIISREKTMITKVLEKQKSPGEKAYIIFNDSLQEIDEFFTIGRHPSNNLVFYEDGFVSQKHARIEKRNNKFVIKDLRSKNGTFLNSAQVHEAPLKSNDEVRCGESKFTFKGDLNLDTGVPPEFYESKNQEWQTQLNKVQAFGSSEMPVLVLGPSGTGKELISRALHFNSPRAYGPLVSVNCSAFNAQLIESELFGHLEGSFTGATRNRKGAFQQAKGGTLLLDEIGDLPLDLQPKLLRALENREIRPVGSEKVISTNVRILAATHKSLEEKVQTGEFRQDLYFRLQTLIINAPALKNRMEDFESFLFQFSREYQVRFSPCAIKKLEEYDWPGNIRELKNIVMRASVLFKNSGVDSNNVDQLIGSKPSSLTQEDDFPLQESSNRESLVKQVERDLILSTLKSYEGNQRRAAQALGMPKSTLHDKLKRYFKN